MIKLFIIMFAIGLSAEDKPAKVVPPSQADTVGGPIATAQAPTMESVLHAEIAYLRLLIKELETKQKYADIVCSQPDMLKAKQDVIDAAQKMQTEVAKQKAVTQ